LIEDLNEEMGDNGQEIVVMGTSMGAMVVRYALTLMEFRNQDHNVRLFISHDAPNQGANIPWGYQRMLQQLTFNQASAIFLGFNALVPFINGFTNADISGNQAAFQLLRQSPIPLIGVLSQNFNLQLQAIGDYPNQCRNVAIANGANNGNGLHPLGFQFLDIEEIGGPNEVLLAILGANVFGVYAEYELDIDVFASNGFLSPVYTKFCEARAGLDVFGIELGPRITITQNAFYPSNLEDWDVAPGGYFKFDEVLDEDEEEFTFMPTVTALDLNVNDSYFSVNTIEGFNNTNIPEVTNGALGQKVAENTAYTHSNPISPFAAIWANEMNDFHGDLDDGNAFILQEVAPNTLVVQNRIINGNNNVTFQAKDAVIIGNNESPAFAPGPVIIQNGANVAVIATNGTVLMNPGLTITAGAEVVISIDELNCE